jgi:hypothetical protein
MLYRGAAERYKEAIEATLVPLTGGRVMSLSRHHRAMPLQQRLESAGILSPDKALKHLGVCNVRRGWSNEPTDIRQDAVHLPA